MPGAHLLGWRLWSFSALFCLSRTSCDTCRPVLLPVTSQHLPVTTSSPARCPPRWSPAWHLQRVSRPQVCRALKEGAGYPLNVQERLSCWSVRCQTLAPFGGEVRALSESRYGSPEGLTGRAGRKQVRRNLPLLP